MQVTCKVKGLLKGLRCISQIFEPHEKEKEMQIGQPTDVKHVAHIGFDGPTASSPNWMDGFKQPPEVSSAPSTSTTRESKGKHSKKSEGTSNLPEAPKPTRRHHNQGSTNDNEPDVPKTSRRRHSIATANAEASDAPKQHRQHGRKSSLGDGSGSPTKESSSSKHTRRRKASKSVDGSSKSSGSKVTDPDVK